MQPTPYMHRTGPSHRVAPNTSSAQARNPGLDTFRDATGPTKLTQASSDSPLLLWASGPSAPGRLPSSEERGASLGIFKCIT